MATLTVQVIDSSDTTTGLVPTFDSADAGLTDEFINDGKTFFMVKNGGGGGINITINSRQDCDQGFDHNYVVALGAGNDVLIGRFGKPRFNQTTTELVTASYDSVASVEVAAIQLG